MSYEKLNINTVFKKSSLFIFELLNFTWGIIGLNKTFNVSIMCREINVYSYVYIHIYVAIHNEYNLPG